MADIAHRKLDVVLGEGQKFFQSCWLVLRHGQDSHGAAALAQAHLASLRTKKCGTNTFLTPFLFVHVEANASMPILLKNQTSAQLHATLAHAGVSPHLARRLLAATQLVAKVPVISVCAVRTGCGKSPVSRRIATELRKLGWNPVVVRHPMPYGDLAAQHAQRFGSLADLDKNLCTIEEREEYEPHIIEGTTVYAGVDYEEILRQAEKEGDVVLWDGGNNDTSFYRPDLDIVVLDPHRPGHELAYYPGEVNFRSAHVLIINKVDTADPDGIKTVRQNIALFNPKAQVIETACKVSVADPEAVRGKRVLVIEDGPTLTHGEMPYGAGVVAANRYNAATLVDPRPYAVGSIQKTFEKFPHLWRVLPAM